MGGKGANLGEMTQAGLPVQPGFVVTAAAYRTHVATAVLTSYRRLRDEAGGAALKVAVRSSATAEDLPDVSFVAGQQETYLGIDHEDALLNAVQPCWASLWQPRVTARPLDDHEPGATAGQRKRLEPHVIMRCEPLPA